MEASRGNLNSDISIRPLIPNKGNVLDLLENSNNFTLFLFIIKLAKLESIFTLNTESCTFFIPEDNNLKQKYNIDNIICNMDEEKARSIVHAHFFNKSVEHNLLPYYNINAKVLKTLQNRNSFIHIVDSFLVDPTPNCH